MKFVAITACPAGIAHTYMAAEKLEQAARTAGHEITVETQGAIGVENELSKAAIEAADAVVIAADKQIDLERFAGKKVLVTGVADAVARPGELLEEALQAKPSGPKRVNALEKASQAKQAERGQIYKALMNGVSYMIPFVVTGGLLIAISLSIGGTPTAAGLHVQEGSFWFKVLSIGTTAFTLMVPILSGYIAHAIADRPGLVPGMIGGFIANSGTFYDSKSGAGFIGAIITGFAAGYLALALKKIPVPKHVRPIMPIIVIPIVTTLVIGLAFIFVLGQPIANLFIALTEWLSSMQSTSAVIIGVIIGLMVAFDMGGPVNKTAVLFAGGLIASGNTALMGMAAAAIAVPPLGMGLASVLRRRLFTENERENGIAALFIGFFGITEGAIPFAAEDPLRVTPANMAGGAVAAGLAALFGAGDAVLHGGPIVALLGAVSNIGGYVVAIAAGTIVTAVLAIVLKSRRTTAPALETQTPEEVAV